MTKTSAKQESTKITIVVPREMSSVLGDGLLSELLEVFHQREMKVSEIELSRDGGS